jgi:hypothetical protein
VQCYFEARSRAGYLFTANQIGAIESLTAILTAAPPDKDEKGRNYILMKARNIQECCSMMNQDELTERNSLSPVTSAPRSWSQPMVDAPACQI